MPLSGVNEQPGFLFHEKPTGVTTATAIVASMNNAVFDPENYCPICGHKLAESLGHSCNEKVLAYIDAARRRDYVQVRQPSKTERLKLGFQLLDDDPEDENELAKIVSSCQDAKLLHWF